MNSSLKWVSLRAQYPKRGQKVILLVNGRARTGYRNDKWEGGFCTYGNTGSCITGATHWLPWPKR